MPLQLPSNGDMNLDMAGTGGEDEAIDTQEPVLTRLLTKETLSLMGASVTP